MAKKLQEEFRDIIRTHHYSYLTGVTYWNWARRFILFHKKRHPRDMGVDEIRSFLSYLAVQGKVSASTQNQALSSLLFLYKKVLGIDLPFVEDVVRARRPVRVPVVLTKAEVAAVLGAMQGKYWLMAKLMYGGGLRLNECLRLRVQDIDKEMLKITVRSGKGAKNVTACPYLRQSSENSAARAKTGSGSTCFRPASMRTSITTRACVATMPIPPA